MRTYRTTGLLLLAATLLFMSGPAAAQVFNAASDFSPTSNPTPNGAWSYGWSTSRGSQFNPFSTPSSCPVFDVSTGFFGSGNLDVWAVGYCPPPPAVLHNGTNDTLTTVSTACCNPVPSGGLALHPGPSGENAIVRWTAPLRGVYKVTATFSGLDFGGQAGTTTDVAVLHNSNNSAPIFAGNIVGFGSHNAKSFSGTVSVLPGDTIDFTVGFGPDFDYTSDLTGLDAVITAESQVLTSDLTNLFNGTNLNATQKSQLNRLVSTIDTSLTSGNRAAAIGNLEVLVADIVFLMWSTPSLVPAALGDHLITDANEAIASLRS